MSSSAPRKIEEDRHRVLRRIISLFLLFGIIPALVLCGIFFFDDRKYYIISIAIMLFSAVPLVLRFERRMPQARELVLLAVMSGIAVASRAAFYFLPSFKPITAIIIIAGAGFGAEGGFIVGSVSAFVSNFFFGQGPWTPWQMFAMGLCGFMAGLFFHKGLLARKRLPLCIFGFLMTMLYGFIMDTGTPLMYASMPSTELFLQAYALGFWLNVIHAACTVVTLLLLAIPFLEKIDRVKQKYGILGD